MWKHLRTPVIQKLRRRVKQGKWQDEDKAFAQRRRFLNTEMYKLPPTSVLLFLQLTLLLQLCSWSLFLFVLVGFSNCKGQYCDARHSPERLLLFSVQPQGKESHQHPPLLSEVMCVRCSSSSSAGYYVQPDDSWTSYHDTKSPLASISLRGICISLRGENGEINTYSTK